MEYMIIDALEGRRRNSLSGALSRESISVYEKTSSKMADAVEFVANSTNTNSGRVATALAEVRAGSARLRAWLEGTGNNPNELTSTISIMDGQLNGLVQSYFPGTIKPSVATLAVSAIGGIAVGLVLTKIKKVLG